MPGKKRKRSVRRFQFAPELMESRLLLSSVVAAVQNGLVISDDSVVLKTGMATPDGYSTPNGAPITPALMRDAYGLGTYGSSGVTFNGVQGTGAGQTIAIVEAGSDPDIAADLTAFDTYWNLPAPPSLQQLNSTGGTTLPSPGDIGELDLDVEWSHVMAPLANITLFEGNLYTAMTTAAATPGVSVISISYTISGTEGITEFETPAGHSGVSFFSASGDTGGEVNDPAKSPAVIAVGGTDLTVKNNAYSSEVGWSGSGGGINTAEAQPGYQAGVVSAFSTTNRVTPDVAMDADPGTGVAVYDEYDNGTTTPWDAIVGGTSLATPLMAGVVAVADQGRVAAGLTTLDGYTQTLPRLYDLYAANYSANFHDITTGNNSHAAGAGFDEVTGLGSPVGNNLIPDLAGADTITGRAYIDSNSNGTYDAGTDTPLANKTVYLDLGNTGAQTSTDPTATTDANGLYTFADVIGSWTGKVRLAGNAGLLPETNTTLTTAYNTSQSYDLVFASATTYTATASPATVTAFNTSLGVTISGTAASNLTYTWSASTKPSGSSPVFSVNGTAGAQNTTATFNMAGTYVLTVQINDGAGHIATSSVTVTVSQTATSIVVTPVGANITGGATQQMTATELDQFGTALAKQPSSFTWSVTAGTGSISSSGLYTALSTGTLATIKAVTGSLSATTQVYVVSSQWASADIGAPALAGSAYDSSGVFNITGAGADITGTSDQFHFVYRALGGDGTIIARVASQSNTNAAARAGVMIRSSLDPAAQVVLMGLTPTSGTTFESRTTAGGTITSSSVSGLAAPYYVKLVRSGNTITGYYSSNGVSWTLASSATVIMTGSVYIGLFDTSHNTAALSTVTIDNVSLMDAADDTLTASAGSPGSVNVLTNDVGISGILTVTGVTQGSEGTVTIGSGGVLTYTTSAVAAGTDSFNYTVTDGAGNTATATVTVNILGLEAYYKMNEGTGTTTADSSGNGNTATVSGATWTTGVAGEGLAFAGNASGDAVTVPVLNLNTNTATFSGWVYSSGTQNSSSGIIFNRNGTSGNGLDMYNGTTLGYTWGTAAGTYNYNSHLTLPTDTWTFVALVVTATNATIYMDPLNGTLSSATNTLANAVQSFSTVTLLGQDSSSSSRVFNGSMDEVRIYNTALSLSAITALGKSSSFLTAAPDVVTAYAGSPGTVNVLTNDAGPNGSTLAVSAFTQPSDGTVVNNGNGSFTYSTTSLFSGTDSFTYTLSDGLGDTTTGTVTVTVRGMIAYYKFDEGAGTAAADATGDGYTGTVNNATWSTGLTGISSDDALVFNGTSTDVTFAANSPSLSGTTDFSVGAWIKTTSTSGGVVIQQRDANGFEGEYQVAINAAGTVSFYLYNNAYQFDITSTKKVNDGAWHQITAVRNGSSGILYIDGVQVATGSGAVLSLTNTITVGIGADIRSPGTYFKGTIDDVMIFNNALSASELVTVSALPTVVTAAAATPSPVTGTTTTLSVLGGDFYEAESNLTYTWAATTVPAGAVAPTFSPDGTNAAKITVVTFHKAGSYVFTVTIADPAGRSTMSTVSVTVNQTLTSVALSAINSTVIAGGTTQATAYDQFGAALTASPVWGVSGGGTISSSGLFTAGAVGGVYTITATPTGGSAVGTSVTVVPTSYAGTVGNDTYTIRLSPTDSTLEQIFVNTPETAAPTYQISLVQLATLAFTPASDGKLTVDFANGNPLPANGISFSGGNALYIEGVATGHMAFTINAAQVIDTAAASSPISYTGIQSVEFDLNGGSNILTQQAQPKAAVVYNAGTGSNTLTVNGGTFNITADPQTSSGSLTVNDNSDVVFAAAPAGGGYAARNLAALNLSAAATATLTASTTASDRIVLVTGQFTTGGTLDLGNNALIVHNGNLATLSGQLQTGSANGQWNGTGITSLSAQNDSTHLTALGVLLNNNGIGGTIYGSFDNQTVSATDVLVKYTYYGDANLDGQVDGSDYTKIDNGFNNHLTGWLNGDFNYDSAVDGSDYTLIDNAFNQQGASAAAVIAPAGLTATTMASGKSSFPVKVAAKPTQMVFTAPAPFRSGPSLQFDPSIDPADQIFTDLRRKDVVDSLGVIWSRS